MKRSLSLLLILVLLMSCAVLFAGCSEEEDAEYPVTIGEVTVTQEPKNVVVLNDSFADIIAYMGYDTKLIARSDECDQEFLSFFPSVGSTGSVTAASIVATGADLVIADGTLGNDIRSELTKNGVTVVTLNPAKDLNSLKTLYTQLGTLLGGKNAGSKKAERSYNSLINMLGQYKTLPIGVVKTSVYLYLDENAQLCTFTQGSFEQQLYDYNGSVNILSHQQEPQVVESELRIGSPGYIFYDNDAVLEYLRSNESLMNLKALREDMVCRIPLKNFYRYGTSCEQIINTMAAFLDVEPAERPATADEATPDEAPDDAYDDWYDDDSDDWYDDSDDDWYEDDWSEDDWSDEG